MASLTDCLVIKFILNLNRMIISCQESLDSQIIGLHNYKLQQGKWDMFPYFVPVRLY